MAESLGLKNKSTRGSREVYPGSLLGTRKQFSDTYLVKADNTSESEDDILGATGIPDLYSLNGTGYLKKKEAREVDSSALLWEVVCSYDSHLDTGARAVNWRWEVEEIEEVLTHDVITGAPIQNSVKEPFTPQAPYTIPVLVIERLEASFDPDIIINFSNRVNSHPFWGAPPFCALLKGPTAERESIAGVDWWRVTYRIKFNLKIDPDTKNPKGWFLYLLNHGTKYKEDADDTSYVKFKDKEGKETTGNLKLDGTKNTGDPIWLGFNRYNIANFNSLQLGPFSNA